MLHAQASPVNGKQRRAVSAGSDDEALPEREERAGIHRNPSAPSLVSRGRIAPLPKMSKIQLRRQTLPALVAIHDEEEEEDAYQRGLAERSHRRAALIRGTAYSEARDDEQGAGARMRHASHGGVTSSARVATFRFMHGSSLTSCASLS